MKREGADAIPACPFKVPASFPKHPGGQTLLGLGRKSLRPDLLFLSYHMGADLDGAVARQAKLLNVTLPARGPMYDEIHQALRKVKAAHPEQHWVHVGWSLLLTILLPILLTKFYFNPQLWSSTVLGTVFGFYFLAIFHTRHHKGGMQYGIPWLDTITFPIYEAIECIWGIFPPAWRNNHQGDHHVFTNFVDEHDVESPFPLLRLDASQELMWYHRFQTYYAPLVFTMTTVTYPYFNVIWGIPKYWPVVWFILNWGIPYYLNGWSGVCNTLFLYASTGIILSYAFQVSHNHVKLGNRYATVGNVDDWIKRQVEQSVSWGGYISTVVMGGLNYQIEHHVAPAMDTPYYYFFRPELQRICKKYRVNYTFEPTGVHAIYQYHKFLTSMAL